MNVRLAAALFGLCFAGSLWAQEAPEPEKTEKTEEERLQVFDEIEVTSRADDLVGIADSATEGVTGREDLQRRPLLRPGELLETVPGVIITQHAGGGKANQYFLRGFNLDHGTDFGISVDDVPVNMPSHGHGQGYSDLNFLIPEMVDSIRYRKGPYDASVGDFSAAGSASLRYVDRLDAPLLDVSGGSFGYRRAVAGHGGDFAGGHLLGAVEFLHNDGPWERPDDYRKGNLLLRYKKGDEARGFSLTATGYDGRWDSSDQIPERAVGDGRVGRLGTIDPTTGGDSHRYSLSFEMQRGSEQALQRLTVYALHYDLDLFSNFTYFLDDPVHGDQFEQQDRRFVSGLRWERLWTGELAGRKAEHTLGLQARNDDIANGLFHTQARRRLSTTRTDDIGQLSGAPYFQTRVAWTPWLRTVTGLRWDSYRFRVDSNLAANSGEESQSILSPKLSVVFGPWNQTEVYFNAGWGFHSNDARGATIRIDPATGELAQRVSPLVRGESVDVGFRTSFFPGTRTAVTLFNLDLDSELLFVGDAGATEASRPSRRSGVELQSFFHLGRRLVVDADLALSRSRFRDPDPAGDRIPGAIERALALGISLPDWEGWSGSARLRYFGPRPLIEDDSRRSDSSSLVYLQLARKLAHGFQIGVEVFNLLDDKVSDIDYFYPSRLPGEPEEGIEDIHFHPAESRSVRLVAGWKM